LSPYLNGYIGTRQSNRNWHLLKKTMSMTLWTLLLTGKSFLPNGFLRSNTTLMGLSTDTRQDLLLKALHSNLASILTKSSHLLFATIPCACYLVLLLLMVGNLDNWT